MSPDGSARGAGAAPARLVWLLVAPALTVVATFAVLPLAWTLWESLRLHDLRMPWRGSPFVGLANYAEAFWEPRFWEAVAHTAVFAGCSVSLELLVGTALALALHRAFRGRAIVRAAVLIPWAIPTVVAALVWRFIFEGETSLANTALMAAGALQDPLAWFAGAVSSWVPLVLADVWKTTPFVTLLLLAGLQNIDPVLDEAARIDGAGAWRRFTNITLPMLAPALLVAVIFRSLDALRVFDLIFVMSGGGPGTATEPIALYTHTVLLQHLRFGYGSALALLIFAGASILTYLYVRLLQVDPGAGTE